MNRDRKEFLGNDVDILDKFKTEFGVTDDGEASPSASTATQPNPAAPATPPSPPAESGALPAASEVVERY